jgi:hypothetical protein
MRWNLCLIVDSNLKHVQLGSNGRKGNRPYLSCPGDVFCVYKVDPTCKDWPSIPLIQEKQYTDLVIALGINHCCRSITSQDKAISDLRNLFTEYRRSLPNVRLYFVHVPPSLNTRTSVNAKRFNDSMTAILQSLNVQAVEVPERLFTVAGTLDPLYARSSELAPQFPHDRKLHLNREGQRMVVYRIKRTLSVTANMRMR